MRPVRTLFVLGSSLGLATILACKKPVPTPEPTTPAVKTEPKTDTSPEVKTTPVDTTKPTDMTASKFAEFQRAAASSLKDINFELDKSDIRDGDKPKLQAIASFMKSFAQARIMIEGHCDERGTVEYNLALGDRRAVSAQNYLSGLGVSRDRLNTISYGKEKPKAMGHEEESFFVNRRCEFKIQN